MNKLPTSPRLRRTGIIFLCFGAVVFGATSHAMDCITPEELGAQLRIAVCGGNINQVEALLKQGATIDAKDNNGNTPLMYAASCGREQICKLLIDNKASIDAKSNDSWTPLMYVTRNGREQTCKLLIENKATIDAKANDGNTPLMQAASWDHEQICKLLIDALLVPVKEKQAAAIALMGIKKYKKSPCVGFNQNDREVIRLIVRPAYECSKRQLFAQINMIKNENFKQRLVDYAKQQLRAQKMEAFHE